MRNIFEKPRAPFLGRSPVPGPQTPPGQSFGRFYYNRTPRSNALPIQGTNFSGQSPMPAAYQYGAGISGGAGYETWGTPNNVQNNQGQANTGYTPYTPTNIFSAGGSATPTPIPERTLVNGATFHPEASEGRPNADFIPVGQTQQPTASAQQPAAAAPQDTGFTYNPEGGSLLSQLSSAYGGQTHQEWDGFSRAPLGFTQGFTDFFTGEGFYADPRPTYHDAGWDISDKPINLPGTGGVRGGVAPPPTPQDTGFTYDPEGGSLLSQLSSAYGGQTHNEWDGGRGGPGFTQGFTDFFTGEGYYADPRPTFLDGGMGISDKPFYRPNAGTNPRGKGAMPELMPNVKGAIRQTTSSPSLTQRKF